jgi:LacI family transcriptional regulator
MGFDDAPISQQIYPRLTTVVQPIAAMARASIEILGNSIENKNVHPECVEIPTHLVVRNSCAVPKKLSG